MSEPMHPTANADVPAVRPQRLRRMHGGRLDRLHRGHAVADHPGKLLRVVPVGIDPRVCAEDHLDTSRMRAAEGLTLRFGNLAILLRFSSSTPFFLPSDWV